MKYYHIIAICLLVAILGTAFCVAFSSEVFAAPVTSDRLDFKFFNYDDDGGQFITFSYLDEGIGIPSLKIVRTSSTVVVMSLYSGSSQVAFSGTGGTLSDSGASLSVNSSGSVVISGNFELGYGTSASSADSSLPITLPAEYIPSEVNYISVKAVTSSSYNVYAPTGYTLSSTTASDGSYTGYITDTYKPMILKAAGSYTGFNYNPFTGALFISGITSNISLASVVNEDNILYSFAGTSYDYIGTQSSNGKIGITMLEYDDGYICRGSYSGTGDGNITLVFKSKKPGQLLEENVFSGFVENKYVNNGFDYQIKTETVNNYVYVYFTITGSVTSNVVSIGYFTEELTPQRYTVHFYIYSSNAFTITTAGDVVELDSDIGTVTYSGTSGSRIYIRWTGLPTEYDYTYNTINNYGSWFGSPASAISFLYSFGDNKYDVSTVSTGLNTDTFYYVKINMYNNIISALLEQKYNEGKQDGLNSNASYWQAKIDTAFSSGHDSGYSDGYNAGLSTADNGSFTSLFSGLANVPSTVLGGFLDFELLGTTGRNIIFFFITLLIVIAVTYLIIKFW